MSFKQLVTTALLILMAAACRKDEKILKSAGTLEFTTDIVYFDTVFTRLPGSPYPRSINKRFLVHNPYTETVNVNVRIGKGTASEFRMNVDGRGGIANVLEILPKDSAWIFVEATLEPNLLNHPALVRDSIIFETNGNEQHVKLAAYGWDAYYFKDSVLDPAVCNWTLTNKPYVIVNTVFVDENKTLNIGPGVHVYSTTNSYLTDTNNVKYGYHALNVLGTLKINGTKAKPVIFEGDRLDNDYANTPGQWQGIGFYRTSKDNEITHAIIKNATYGVRVDSLSNNTNPKLTIKNTIIKNMSGIGIWGRTGDIYAENTVVSNCTIYWFFAQIGGKYRFFHCTFNNTNADTKDAHLAISNQLRDQNRVVIKNDYPLDYTFVNSIINGPNEKEMVFDLGKSPTTAIINYCMIRYVPAFGGPGNIFTVDVNYPQFEDPGNSILRLKSTSPARDKGTATSVGNDLDDNPRSDGKPDMGAFEVQ